GTVAYFNDDIGPTADYTFELPATRSADVAESVSSALHAAGDDGAQTDRCLVIDIDYGQGDLDPNTELDRWVSLTRFLGRPDTYAGTAVAVNVAARYRSIVYTRLIAAHRATGRPLPILWRRRFLIPAGYEIAMPFVTDVSPELQ